VPVATSKPVPTLLQPQMPAAPTTATFTPTPGLGIRVPIMSAIHIPEGQHFTGYNSSPPTSGPHWPRWAQCGIYDSESQAPDSRVVHNLEHGQVIVSHNLKSEAEIGRLREVVLGLPGSALWVIMRPYSPLAEGEVALTSWGWLDRFQGVDQARVRAFYDIHVNRAPESIPCTPAG
jgi:hypothetical protein